MKLSTSVTPPKVGSRIHFEENSLTFWAKVTDAAACRGAEELLLRCGYDQLFKGFCRLSLGFNQGSELAEVLQ